MSSLHWHIYLHHRSWRTNHHRIPHTRVQHKHKLWVHTSSSSYIFTSCKTCESATQCCAKMQGKKIEDDRVSSSSPLAWFRLVPVEWGARAAHTPTLYPHLKGTVKPVAHNNLARCTVSQGPYLLRTACKAQGRTTPCLVSLRSSPPLSVPPVKESQCDSLLRSWPNLCPGRQDSGSLLIGLPFDMTTPSLVETILPVLMFSELITRLIWSDASASFTM